MNSKIFKRYLEENWKHLYRAAYAWCGNPDLAMDLVQDTSIKALRQHHQLKDEKAIRGWLFTILMNNWRDHCRKHLDMLDIEETAISHYLTPEIQNRRMETLDRVRHACMRLNQDHREVLSLVALEGMSYEETAQVLGISTGTVMSRLCRARENLRHFLDEIDHAAEEPRAKIRRIK